VTSHTVALGISASQSHYPCVLRRSDGVLLHDDGDDNQLASTVARLFHRAGCAPSDLNELRLDLGPGSYTGLRVAVTFARALLEFGDLRVLTTTSLELRALHAWTDAQLPVDRVVRPVLDARRQRFHHAPIRLGTVTQAVAEPRATSAAELLADIGEGEIVLADNSIQPILQQVCRDKQCELLAPSSQRPNICELLFDARIGLRETSGEQLQPLYLMGSYAGEGDPQKGDRANPN